MKITRSDMANIIDHTNLNASATTVDIEKLCSEAIKYKFYAVCVNPCFVTLVKKFLATSTVRICTVIGFPLGTVTTAIKIAEAKEAISNGAHELDMVINIGWLKDKKYDDVKKEVENIVDIVRNTSLISMTKITVKVIIETCELTEAEKIQACELAKQAGAHYIKTSTGFGKSGANIYDVKLIRKTIDDTMGIKAAGGIKTVSSALALIDAGASRIGTSSGIEILEGIR